MAAGGVLPGGMEAHLGRPRRGGQWTGDEKATHRLVVLGLLLRFGATLGCCSCLPSAAGQAAPARHRPAGAAQTQQAVSRATAAAAACWHSACPGPSMGRMQPVLAQRVMGLVASAGFAWRPPSLVHRFIVLTARRDAAFDALMAGSDEEGEGGQPSQSLGGRGGGAGSGAGSGSDDGSDDEGSDGSSSDADSDAESEGGVESAQEDIGGGSGGALSLRARASARGWGWWWQERLVGAAELVPHAAWHCMLWFCPSHRALVTELETPCLPARRRRGRRRRGGGRRQPRAAPRAAAPRPD